MKIKMQFNDVFLIIASVIAVLRLVICNLLSVDAIFFISDLLMDVFMLGASFIFFFHKFVSRDPLRKIGFEWPLLMMFAAAGISFFYTIDQSMTLRSSLHLFSMAAFFYALVNALDTPLRQQLFLWAMFFVAAVVAIFAIKDMVVYFRTPLAVERLILDTTHNNMLSYLIVHHRATSFMGWPNMLAGYLLLIVPFAGLLVFFTRPIGLRLFFAVLLGVFVGGFLFTYSFLGWFSLFLSSIVMIPFFLKNFIGAWTSRVRISMVGIVALFFVLFFYVIAHKDFSGSIAPRIIYYKNAFVLMTQKPLLGQGFGTFGLASKPMITSLDGISDHLHNTYLQWWVEAGLLGFLGIIFFLYVFLRKGYAFLRKSVIQQEDWIAFSLLWGLLAFFIDNFLSYSFIQPNVSFYAWVMLALFLAMIHGKEEFVGNKGRFISAIICLNCLFAFYLTLRMCLAFTVCHQGFASFLEGDLKGANEALAKSSRLDPWSMKYPQIAGNMALQTYGVAERGDYLKAAEANYLEALRREPAVYVNYYVLSKIYFYLQDQPRSDFFLHKAQQISPFEFSMDVQSEKMNRKLF